MEQRVTTYSQYSHQLQRQRHQEHGSADPQRPVDPEDLLSAGDVNLDLAIAQIVSATNAIRALMPPGIQPPIVVAVQRVERACAAASLNSIA
jgi:hypothetical protein